MKNRYRNQGAQRLGELLRELGTENRAKIDASIRRHGHKKGALIPVLQGVQRSQGYISRPAMAYIAHVLHLPLAEVFGVASFYSQFSLEKKGENLVRVCLGTACHVKGADKVLAAFSDHLGIAPGSTTEDKSFSLERVACIGACGLAPVVVINEKTYPKMDPGAVAEAIEETRAIRREKAAEGEIEEKQAYKET